VKENPPNFGDIIEVTTDRLAFGGEAVARHDGLAIFVPLAVPGERLRVRITERKKNYARAAIENILEPSPDRREPPCHYFGECGGCQLQHMSYESQLRSKVGFVRDALKRIGRIDWPQEIPIRHAAEFGYRGRAQIKIDSKTGRVGFNRTASHSVCDVVSCPILIPELDAALSSLRAAVAGTNVNGRVVPDLRQIDVAAGENGVAFEPAISSLASVLLSQTASGAVYGFDPETFFQSNPALLDVLIEEAVGGSSGDFALDLYAGVGLFTIQLARRFKRVIGVEADPRTAKHAIANIAANGAANVEFCTSPADSWLKAFIASTSQSPDLLVLDPPRAGAAQAIPPIIELGPRMISYVSCDPATLARDLRPLVDGGYTISKITAIDLFPQTYHVETVALLNRR
jgi:23S rRNA (uracil1939-C5)-methyltransferase